MKDRGEIWQRRKNLFESLLHQYNYLLPEPSGQERGWIIIRTGPMGHHFVKRGGWTRHAGAALVFPRGRDARRICEADVNMFAIPTNTFCCTKCWEHVPWDYGCYLEGDGEQNEWCDACWYEEHKDDDVAA